MPFWRVDNLPTHRPLNLILDGLSRILRLVCIPMGYPSVRRIRLNSFLIFLVTNICLFFCNLYIRNFLNVWMLFWGFSGLKLTFESNIRRCVDLLVIVRYCTQQIFARWLFFPLEKEILIFSADQRVFLFHSLLFFVVFNFFKRQCIFLQDNGRSWYKKINSKLNYYTCIRNFKMYLILNSVFIF